MYIQQIGSFTETVINLLGLSIPVGTPIFLGDGNIKHMKTKHSADYQKYGADISSIINSPDYIGINQKDNSIEFVKEYIINNEYVKVAVRVSTTQHYFARSLYVLNTNRVKNFIKKGTLLKT